jgi:outer membrane protein OmpA-like peptidoglycan-associated protein
MRRVFAIAILFFCTSSLVAFAQDSGKTGSKADSNSTSSSGSQAAVNNNITQGGGGFTNALPGTINNTIPGFVATVSPESNFGPLNEVPISALKDIRKKVKPKAVYPKHPLFTQQGEQEGDSIHLIDWNPDKDAYPGDFMLGQITVVGDKNVPIRDLALWGLSLVVEKTGSHRCAAVAREFGRGQTSGFNIGAGASGAANTQSGTGLAGSGGAGFGRTGTEIIPHAQVIVSCLGPGRLARPRAEDRAEVRPTPPPTDELKTAIGELKDAIKELANRPAPVQTLPNPPTGLTAAVNNPIVDPCDGMPKVTILFDFDKSSVKPGYLSTIKDFGTWLKAHPACHVQVLGNTCNIGKIKYNANLARSRAKAVYDVLMRISGNELGEQVKEWPSRSYDNPVRDNRTSEAREENRRVIFEEVGMASGK